MIKALFIESPMIEAEMAGLITPEELSVSQQFWPQRRQEYLTWRAIVRRELGAGVGIDYNAVGGPVVAGIDAYISVSHCSERVAVCISDRPCAVDIEPGTRNFSRVMARYMSASEQNLSSNPLLPAVVWCAKETLYKYAGRMELDLLRDLHINEVDFDAGVVLGQIENEAPIRLSLCLRDDFVVVYIL